MGGGGGGVHTREITIEFDVCFLLKKVFFFFWGGGGGCLEEQWGQWGLTYIVSDNQTGCPGPYLCVSTTQ